MNYISYLEIEKLGWRFDHSRPIRFAHLLCINERTSDSHDLSSLNYLEVCETQINNSSVSYFMSFFFPSLIITYEQVIFDPSNNEKEKNPHSLHFVFIYRDMISLKHIFQKTIVSLKQTKFTNLNNHMLTRTLIIKKYNNSNN